MGSTNELAAQIKAVNLANQYATELQPRLTALFAPLVGQLLLKKDGSLLAKVKKLLPELPNTPRLQVYMHRSTYCLAFIVKTCVQVEGEHHCVYFEQSVNVGDIDNGVLTKVYDNRHPYKTDYTLEDILQKRKKAEDLEQQYRDARDACYPFGPG